MCVEYLHIMSDENIRRRVVNSFRKAIDFEQQNNDVVSGYSSAHLFKLTFTPSLGDSVSSYHNDHAVEVPLHFIRVACFRRHIGII